MDKQAFLKSPDEGNTHRILGNQVVFLVRGEDTAGEYSVFLSYESKGLEPPPHVHTHEDEAFYVLEGVINYQIGDQTLRATPGTYVYAPRGIPHTFSLETTAAKVLASVYPAGFENFFLELGELSPGPLLPLPNLPPDHEKMKELGSIADRYGIHFL